MVKDYEGELAYYTLMKEGEHTIYYSAELCAIFIDGSISKIIFKEQVFKDAIKAMKFLTKKNLDAERVWLLLTLSENIRIMSIWHDLEKKMPIY